MSWTITFLLIALFAPNCLQALSVEELEVSYLTAVLKNSKDREERLAVLDQGYQGALARLGREAQKNANLKEALAVKKESELIKGKTWPLPPIPEDLKRILAKPRATYVKARLGIDSKWAEDLNELTAKMEKALSSQKESFTRRGDLKSAQAAADLITKINENADVARAKALLERVDASGRSRAGYLIRRNGDDIEVLVRYDAEGKISPKSPVENVVEITGGKRERGKTKARTLGEFLGINQEAKHPLVVLNHTAEDGKLVPDRHPGVEIDFRKAEGTVYSIENGTKNPLMEFQGILGAQASPATYRMTCELMVPETNKIVSGIQFFQGSGTSAIKLGDKIEGTDKWQTYVRVSSGGGGSPLLRAFFTGFQLPEVKKAWADEILVKSLKIEFVRFSAHIIEQYGSSGEKVLSETDPSRQKLLVRNGVFEEAP